MASGETKASNILTRPIGKEHFRLVMELIEPQPSPERNLIASVVLQAIRDAMGSKTIGYESKENRAHKGEEAREWLRVDAPFKEDEPEPKPFSFRWCADGLDWHPEQMRRAVVKFLSVGDVRLLIRKQRISYSQEKRFKAEWV